MMHTDDFEHLIVAVLDSLPPAFAPYLANVEFIIEQRPTPQQRRELGLQPHESLYGYYEGVPLTERSTWDFEIPTMIIIFQEPLEQDFSDPAELRDQVRQTVLHEVAHHFGISDDHLHELGAY